MNTFVAVALVVFVLAPQVDQCDQINFARATPASATPGLWVSYPQLVVDRVGVGD